MSPLYDKIKTDIVTAMKGGHKQVTDTLRLLVDSIQKKMGAKKIDIAQVTDDIVIDCINSAIKQREESIAEFEKGKRDDLIQKELSEIHIIKQYQPVQMSEEELTLIIKAIVLPHVVNKDKVPLSLGLVMKDVMLDLKGKADGKLINNIVKKILSTY